jgi:acrylyl-CoA reductase (NADPH)
LDKGKLDALTTEIDLSDVPDWARRILKGEVRGRVVVRVEA